MSKYRLIQTEFHNLESLKKALADLGVEYKLAANAKVPDLEMRGYLNDIRPERASLVISKDWLDEHWSGNHHHNGVSNDIGFTWDGKSFTAIVSDYDTYNQGVTDAMNKLRQRYSFHELNRLARSKGYNVRETATTETGQIRLVLVRR